MSNVENALEGLGDYYKKRLESDNIPGMAIAITDRERTISCRTLGVADVSSGERVTEDTLFQIGSISKSFTAIALLQLAERGELDLHAPVKEYLSWFDIRSKHAPITLHHLLTHTAGIPIGSESTIAPESEVWVLREMETSTPPGEFFHYSNTGYKALGLVLEAVTGMPCQELVRRNVVEPLGMTKTHVSITNEIRPLTATGYTWLHDDRPAGRRSTLVPATWSESTSADGSISSVPEDMAAYIRMFLQRGEGPDGRIISEESFELLIGRYIVPIDNYHGESYGYGLNIEDCDGHVLVWHTGGMVGFTSAMLMDMNLGIGMIALTNSLSGPNEIARHTISTVRAATEGKQFPDPVIQVHAYVPEEPGQFVGTYRGAHASLDISLDGSMLVTDIGGKRYILEGLKEDNYLVDHPSYRQYPLRFTRSQDEITGLVHGPDTYLLEPCDRVEPSSPSPEEWNAYVGHYRSYSPWLSSIRVVLRGGGLVLYDPGAGEEPLQPLSDGSFRIGADPRSPERIRFDMVIGGKAFRASLSGGYLHRSFMP